MFFRILKKDLKRRKTMNIILLLFIILCSMFASASLNNIYAVNGGIDHFFEVSDAPDIEVTISDTGINDPDGKIEAAFRELPGVREIRTERILIFFSSKYFQYKGEKLDTFVNPAFAASDSEMGMNYFDEDNNVIEHVEKGYFYSNSPFLQNTDIKKGDEVTIAVGDLNLKLTYAGRLKSAFHSNEDSANAFLLLNHEDFETASAEDILHMQDYTVMYVHTDDVKAVEDLAKDYSFIYLSTQESMRGNFLYDMLVAYVLMAISIVLMITAFVVLHFTISFTIGEEFREIGVMKAVGISNTEVRKLYIVKYLAIAVVGAVIGFFASIPLNNMMLRSISGNMVFGDDGETLTLGIISSVMIVIIVMFFCYLCTRKIKKLSPIDAVRNGETGERFKRRSIMRLGRSRLPSTGFLGMNDVASAPARFTIITIVFTLCIIIMTSMSSIATTLQSPALRRFFDIPESEAHILDTEMLARFMMDKDPEGIISDIETKLADNGIPGHCTISVEFVENISHGEKTANVSFTSRKGYTENRLQCDEGSAPVNDSEIAMTKTAMEKIGCGIGDKVTAQIDGKTREFIVTGSYSSFVSPGVWLYEGFDLGEQNLNGCIGFNIHFDGNPTDEEVKDNIEKVKDIFDTEKVFSTSGLINYFTGMSETITSIKQMMMILTIIVTVLVVVLMERSFISKEKSEIALMKAIGISDRDIIIQHTLRFAIVSFFAIIIASVAFLPVSNLIMNFVCSMIGDVQGIKCDYAPLEVFVILPAVLLLSAVIGSYLTALYTRTIKASDTASIE